MLLCGFKRTRRVLPYQNYALILKALSTSKAMRATRRSALLAYAFSTWLKSNSTGVERPKIVTDTRNLLFS